MDESNIEKIGEDATLNYINALKPNSTLDGRGRTLSRWFDFDTEKEAWTFALTEQYVWSKSQEFAKPIGEMSRDELIHALAVTKHELDEMAIAFATFAEGHQVQEMLNLATRIKREVYEVAPGGLL